MLDISQHGSQISNERMAQLLLGIDSATFIRKFNELERRYIEDRLSAGND